MKMLDKSNYSLEARSCAPLVDEVNKKELFYHCWSLLRSIQPVRRVLTSIISHWIVNYVSEQKLFSFRNQGERQPLKANGPIIKAPFGGSATREALNVIKLAFATGNCYRPFQHTFVNSHCLPHPVPIRKSNLMRIESKIFRSNPR